MVEAENAARAQVRPARRRAARHRPHARARARAHGAGQGHPRDQGAADERLRRRRATAPPGSPALGAMSPVLKSILEAGAAYPLLRELMSSPRWTARADREGAGRARRAHRPRSAPSSRRRRPGTASGGAAKPVRADRGRGDAPRRPRGGAMRSEAMTAKARSPTRRPRRAGVLATLAARRHVVRVVEASLKAPCRRRPVRRAGGDGRGRGVSLLPGREGARTRRSRSYCRRARLPLDVRVGRATRTSSRGPRPARPSRRR